MQSRMREETAGVAGRHVCERRKAWECFRGRIPEPPLSVRPSGKSCPTLTCPTVLGPVLGPKLLGVAPFLKDEWDTGVGAAAGEAAPSGGGEAVGYTCSPWESWRAPVKALCLVAFWFTLIDCSVPREWVSGYYPQFPDCTHPPEVQIYARGRTLSFFFFPSPSAYA